MNSFFSLEKKNKKEYKRIMENSNESVFNFHFSSGSLSDVLEELSCFRIQLGVRVNEGLIIFFSGSRKQWKNANLEWQHKGSFL